ncbi:MAG: hypothetical protein JKY81_04705 [Colwellia sp.]|nr:hypothetical protein [Colwellia sp.]
MRIETLKEEIKEAKEVIEMKKEFISRSQQEIAEHLCPFNVGNTVVDGKGVKQVVASIFYKSWGNNNYDFKTFKIKKNGELYKQPHDTYDHPYSLFMEDK